MNLNHGQSAALNQIGLGLALIGEAIQSYVHASIEHEPAVDMREHYSQEAMDARQHPVLTFVRDSENSRAKWADAKRIALANGYQSSGVGGFFTGPKALLAYTDASKTDVEITTYGLTRLREIEARGTVRAA